jgi:GntR family transcriptional regulator, rspAB operon transcriptional repressor
MKMRSPRRGKPAAQTSLRQHAYDTIKARILDSRYEPGAMLSEVRLAEDLQISRTPIREALRELSGQGLIQILPKRGVMVSTLSLRDIVEVYQLREQLECFATRLAAHHAGPDDATAFRADHERAVASMNRGRLREAYDSSILMHDRIIALAANTRLTHFMQLLSDQVHRFGLLTLRNGRVGPALAEHGGIIEAIANGDGASAEALMRRHLREDRDMVLRLTLPASLVPDRLPVLDGA